MSIQRPSQRERSSQLTSSQPSLQQQSPHHRGKQSLAAERPLKPKSTSSTRRLKPTNRMAQAMNDESAIAVAALLDEPTVESYAAKLQSRSRRVTPYREGELFRESRQRWIEMDEYCYVGGMHELRLFRCTPRLSDIQAVRNGAIEFAFVADKTVGFFLHRFLPSLRWSAAPVSWWLLPEAYRVLPPELGPRQGSNLRAVLVDSKTGVVCAQRVVRLEPRFSDVLHSCLRAQSTRRYSALQVDERLRVARDQYRVSETMLERAMIGCNIDELVAA